MVGVYFPSSHLEGVVGVLAVAGVMLVGDAPGDRKAAESNGVLFYPIVPSDEANSWKRFHDEAFDKFINGEYAGQYEAKVIAEFDAYLPENPPWEK